MSDRMLESRTASRRVFLGRFAAACGASAVPRFVRAQPTAANERLGIGVIGTGGMGSSHLDWHLSRDDVRVVALCDVDQRHLDAARSKTGGKCPAFRDFRELLSRPDVDAVVIAAPDHWHGLIAVAAAQAGKHIYCEKPLTNSIAEGRAVCRAVKRAEVVLQTGSHERSSPGAQLARRLVESGRLGEIRRVRIHLPTNDPHLLEVKNLQAPPPEMPVPAELDYDFWLGHAPLAPYTEKRCHFWWRFHSAYGGGEMTDRGAHVIDLAQMILGRDDTGPVRIEAAGEVSPSGFYDAFLQFRFENRYPDGVVMTGDNTGPRGVLFEGAEGKLFVEVHGGALTAEPAALLEGFALSEGNPYELHRRQFLAAIRTGAAVAAPAEAGHRTATICHLNTLSLRLGRAFDWDPTTERSTDDEENARLPPHMRAPWALDA